MQRVLKARAAGIELPDEPEPEPAQAVDAAAGSSGLSSEDGGLNPLFIVGGLGAVGAVGTAIASATAKKPASAEAGEAPAPAAKKAAPAAAKAAPVAARTKAAPPPPPPAKPAPAAKPATKAAPKPAAKAAAPPPPPAKAPSGGEPCTHPPRSVLHCPSLIALMQLKYAPLAGRLYQHPHVCRPVYDAFPHAAGLFTFGSKPKAAPAPPPPAPKPAPKPAGELFLQLIAQLPEVCYHLVSCVDARVPKRLIY